MKRAVGEQIRRYREHRGMTQAALALAIGVDKGTIWRWESGERWPDYDKILAVSGALGVEPALLFQQMDHKPNLPIPVSVAILNVAASPSKLAIIDRLTSLNEDQARDILANIDAELGILPAEPASPKRSEFPEKG